MRGPKSIAQNTEPVKKITKAKAKKEKDPGAPKRPPSAFSVFMDKFRKDFKENFPDNKSTAVVAKEGGAKWKDMSESEKAPYVEKAASNQAEYEIALKLHKVELEKEADKQFVLEPRKSKQESSSANEEMIAYYLKLAQESSKDKMSMLEILEFYETHHNFSSPRKVLIHRSFCRYMLRNGITKESFCDLLLNEDVELNITSCNTKALRRGKMRNKDELKACIGLALSLKELSCDHVNTCVNSSDCLESLVLNENPNGYFVATKDKDFTKKLLQLPGVAVIGGRDGNLILNEPSVQQTKFVDERGEDVGVASESVATCDRSKGLEQIESEFGKACLTNNSSRKRKELSYADDVSDGEGVTSNRRVKQKLEKKFEVEVAKEGGAKWKAISESKLAEESKSNQCASSSSKEKKDLVTLDEEPRCRTLFMGRLNFSISEADVKNFFRNVARVNEVRFSKRKTRARFGHVEFYTAEAAKKALELNGQKLCGNIVHLDYAEKRPNLAKMFASGIHRNGMRDGSGGRHGGRGQGVFYGRGRHWGVGAGRGRVGGFGAGRVRHGGSGAGRGRHEGRDW